jgi:hypothetical protein
MMRVTLAAIAACFVMTGAAAAAGVPQGTYLETCRNAAVDGNRLNAECQDDAGKWKKTWLEGFQYCAGDIVNENGLLKCNGGRLTEEEVNGPAGAAARGELPSGPWAETCRDGVIDGSFLRATCPDRNGTMRQTFIDLTTCSGEIGNVDGQLVCLQAAAPPPPSAVPKLTAMRDTLPTGKWVQYCRSAALTNYMMRAECWAGNGQWQTSDLDLSTCPTTDVTSNGGRLVCQGDD